jgi:hypothetical protein
MLQQKSTLDEGAFFNSIFAQERTTEKGSSDQSLPDHT